MSIMEINICKDFTDTPGSRYSKDGDFSGEEFRDKILIKKLNEAISSNSKLVINFDGGYGYPSSFLEESFGGLIRNTNYTAEELLNTLVFVSHDEPSLIDKVKSYISEAKKH